MKKEVIIKLSLTYTSINIYSILTWIRKLIVMLRIIRVFLRLLFLRIRLDVKIVNLLIVNLCMAVWSRKAVNSQIVHLMNIVILLDVVYLLEVVNLCNVCLIIF